MNTQAEDFDVAKAIFEQLKDLPTDRQQRVLRWITEGLGVSAVPASIPPSLDQLKDSPNAIPRAPAVPSGGAGSAGGGGAAVDIKSFLNAKAPKSDNQFAAVVAYFYRFEAPPAQRRDAVNGDMLQEAARLSGRKRLGNPRATLNNAKAAGYLDGIGPGEFTVNSVGENLVAMTLPGDGDATTKKRAGRQAKKRPSRRRR